MIPIYGGVRKYAETKVKPIKNSTPIHDEFDLMIGVTALENKLSLITDNVNTSTALRLFLSKESSIATVFRNF